MMLYMTYSHVVKTLYAVQGLCPVTRYPSRLCAQHSLSLKTASSCCLIVLDLRCSVGPMPDSRMPTVLASTRLTEVRGFSDFCSEFFQVREANHRTHLPFCVSCPGVTSTFNRALWPKQEQLSAYVSKLKMACYRWVCEMHQMLNKQCFGHNKSRCQ